MTQSPAEQSDPLITAHDSGLEKGWFDRTYFNVHQGCNAPYFLLGAGVYPTERVVDAYVIAVTDTHQYNLKMSDLYERDTIPSGVGPLSWKAIEPMKSWAVSLGKNPSGIAFDLTWTATAGYWACAPIHLDDGRGQSGTFDHGFQSGKYSGWIEVDGKRRSADDWMGQRDRSRGTRLSVARQGVHMWVQARFENDTIGFFLDVDRENQLSLIDGAVMFRDGSMDPILAADHNLTFDDRLELVSARLVIRTQSGAVYEMEADATVCGGGYMAGGGYGGWHGKPRGKGFVSLEKWVLGSAEADLSKLATPMTDRLVSFTRRTQGDAKSISGAGIFEFAHTRSSKYKYIPSIR